MTRLNGRILQPPKLKLGDGGYVRDLIPSRHDRQWNLLDSHVLEGTRIERWALVCFGGTFERKSNIPKFINQLSQNSSQFESMQLLSNVKLLESKLNKIHRAALNNLQLLICIMERTPKSKSDAHGSTTVSSPRMVY